MIPIVIQSGTPLLVILNEVKNLNAFTLCIQILRDAQDDNWVLTDISFPKINEPRKQVSQVSPIHKPLIHNISL